MAEENTYFASAKSFVTYYIQRFCKDSNKQCCDLFDFACMADNYVNEDVELHERADRIYELNTFLSFLLDTILNHEQMQQQFDATNVDSDECLTLIQTMNRTRTRNKPPVLVDTIRSTSPITAPSAVHIASPTKSPASVASTTSTTSVNSEGSPMKSHSHIGFSRSITAPSAPSAPSSLPSTPKSAENSINVKTSSITTKAPEENLEPQTPSDQVLDRLAANVEFLEDLINRKSPSPTPSQYSLQSPRNAGRQLSPIEVFERDATTLLNQHIAHARMEMEMRTGVLHQLLHEAYMEKEM